MKPLTRLLAGMVAFTVAPGAGREAQQDPAALRVDITQAVLDSRGDPLLVANFAPNGSLAVPTAFATSPLTDY